MDWKEVDQCYSLVFPIHHIERKEAHAIEGENAGIERSCEKKGRGGSV